jgi:hypothetical protein
MEQGATARRGFQISAAMGGIVRKCKKMFPSGNKLKDLLKIKDLAFFGLKRNWFLSAKNADQSQEYDREIGNWKLENRAASFKFLISNFCLWPLTFSLSRRRKG